MHTSVVKTGSTLRRSYERRTKTRRRKPDTLQSIYRKYVLLSSCVSAGPPIVTLAENSLDVITRVDLSAKLVHLGSIQLKRDERDSKLLQFPNRQF